MSAKPYLVVIPICKPWDNLDKLLCILSKADMLPTIQVLGEISMKIQHQTAEVHCRHIARLKAPQIKAYDSMVLHSR